MGVMYSVVVGILLTSAALVAPLPAWAQPSPAVGSTHVMAINPPHGTADEKEHLLGAKPEGGEPIRSTAFEFSVAVGDKTGLVSDPQILSTREATQVQVAIGRSMILELLGQPQRASITNPDVANFQIIPPNQLLINGKATGITTLIAWVNGKSQYFDVVVLSDLSLLRQAMKEIAPQEEIEVKAARTSVVLSGNVSNPSLITKAADVAKAFLPEKATVVNLLRLSEPHQIMLKVEVAEVNRTALRELGLDFLNLGNTFALGVFGGTTAGILNTTIDKDGTVFFDPRTSALIRNGNTRTLLRALEQKGLVKSLARPNLIAASGADATFLVGGEFPFPVVQGGAAGTAASVTIQFKPFGVRLDFIPTLNDLGSINLRIAPEVSALDFTNAVTVSGNTVPSLTTRRVRTVVDLKPGQSLAIGGLIQIEDRKALTKFPILADIPVFGALFRSTDFVRNETDLIIFVTPEIVKPLEAEQAPNLEEQMKTTPEEEKELRQIPGG